jgi:hypothetical protein
VFTFIKLKLCCYFINDAIRKVKKIIFLNEGPYHYEGIEKMVVQMGADGTEDKVSVKICSDTNDLCCENVMKKVPNEDWRQGKKQEWVAADFGDCKNLKFKVIWKKTIFV